jgi:hypothetical protein
LVVVVVEEQDVQRTGGCQWQEVLLVVLLKLHVRVMGVGEAVRGVVWQLPSQLADSLQVLRYARAADVWLYYLFYY